MANLLENVIVTRSAAKVRSACFDAVTPAFHTQRIGELRTNGGEAQRLRLGVDGGGCSGFQYTFTLEPLSQALNEGDLIFSRDGMCGLQCAKTHSLYRSRARCGRFFD